MWSGRKKVLKYFYLLFKHDNTENIKPCKKCYFRKPPFQFSTSLTRWELMRLNKTRQVCIFHTSRGNCHKTVHLRRLPSQKGNKNIEIPWKKTYAQIRNLAFCPLAPNLHSFTGIGQRPRHFFNKTCYIFTEQVIQVILGGQYKHNIEKIYNSL